MFDDNKTPDNLGVFLFINFFYFFFQWLNPYKQRETIKKIKIISILILLYCNM